MSDKLIIPPDIAAQVEYEQGIEMSRHHMKIRRGDMIFFTAVQGSILTIIGNNLIAMDAKAYALAFLAFLVSFIGFNNERRLKIHGDGFLKRVKEIERNSKMSLVKTADSCKQGTFTLPNNYMFKFYYLIMAIIWLGFIGFNIYHYMKL